MVGREHYFLAFLGTLIVALLLYLLVSGLDNQRLESLNERLDLVSEETQNTRALLFYAQIFSDDEEAYCSALKSVLNRQLDRGYELLRVLQKLEEANLIADYNQARRHYVLNNLELWLNTLATSQTCKLGWSSTLFFYRAQETCLDCLAQGEILDQVRKECPDAKIYAIADDVGLEMVQLIREKFKVTGVPALVIDGRVVLEGVKSKEAVKQAIGCTP